MCETRDSGILASSLGCSLDSLELLTSCLHVIPTLHYRRAFAHLVYLVLGMHPRASSLTGSLPPKRHPGWESFIYLKDFNLLYVYACVSLRVTACVQESWEARTQHLIPQLVVSSHVGAGIKPLVLWGRRKCSELLSRFSSPMLGILMLPLFLS